MPDPWQVLGLDPGASVSEARAARKRLAKELHPDAHAERDAAVRAAFEQRMTSVNEALAAIVSGACGAAGAGNAAGRDMSERRHRRDGDATETEGTAAGHRSPGGEATFAIDALPVRAFEALFIAAYGLGDILDDEEPYRLDVYLRLPNPCFCRIDLVPDAGGSTVTLSLSSAEGHATPPVAAIRDLLMAEVEAVWVP